MTEPRGEVRNQKCTLSSSHTTDTQLFLTGNTIRPKTLQNCPPDFQPRQVGFGGFVGYTRDHVLTCPPPRAARDGASAFLGAAASVWQLPLGQAPARGSLAASLQREGTRTKQPRGLLSPLGSNPFIDRL